MSIQEKFEAWYPSVHELPGFPVSEQERQNLLRRVPHKPSKYVSSATSRAHRAYEAGYTQAQTDSPIKFDHSIVRVREPIHIEFEKWMKYVGVHESWMMWDPGSRCYAFTMTNQKFIDFTRVYELGVVDQLYEEPKNG